MIQVNLARGADASFVGHDEEGHGRGKVENPMAKKYEAKNGEKF